MLALATHVHINVCRAFPHHADDIALIPYFGSPIIRVRAFIHGPFLPRTSLN